MNKSISFCFVLIGIMISCTYSKTSVNKVEDFNSFLNYETTVVIDEFPEILDDWFRKQTNGGNYNGTEMKALLTYLSGHNNVGGFISKSVECSKFKDLDIRKLEQLNQIALTETGYRKLLTKSNILGAAIEKYANKTQDPLLLQWTNNELDIRYVPSSICEDYGNLEPEQLEDPIIKRLLFIELFVPVYMEECR